MNFSDNAQKKLLKLIAERFSEKAGPDWCVRTTALAAIPDENFRSSLGKDPADYYGAYFSIPGGMFLTMFSLPSSSEMTDAFILGTRELASSPAYGAMKEMMPELEPMAMAEFSNILTHVILDALADAAGMAVFLSAPQWLIDKRERLLKKIAGEFKQTNGGADFEAITHIHIPFSLPAAADGTVTVMLDSQLSRRLEKALG
ncbi:MAG: hypothetical protein A3J70_06180 [Elusimicrobia bacterium RIFCSPHIGHO2_02_FULL_61_10]|nr:MAG: hypothetical protein A3J70_06180 [Elusimicrobia bacterium RIFCSPHIGHO2_02_FULL_61_10]